MHDSQNRDTSIKGEHHVDEKQIQILVYSGDVRCNANLIRLVVQAWTPRWEGGEVGTLPYVVIWGVRRGQETGESSTTVHSTVPEYHVSDRKARPRVSCSLFITVSTVHWYCIEWVRVSVRSELAPPHIYGRPWIAEWKERRTVE